VSLSAHHPLLPASSQKKRKRFNNQHKVGRVKRLWGMGGLCPRLHLPKGKTGKSEIPITFSKKKNRNTLLLEIGIRKK
jgi:hypothetical protein